MVFAVTHFLVRRENPEYSGMMGSVRTSSHVVQMSCRNFPNKCPLKSNSEYKLEKLNLASGRCCPDVRKSSTLKFLDIAGRSNAFKGLSGRLRRNRLADLEFTWNLHEHLLENL